jgi:hypothetical protein
MNHEQDIKRQPKQIKKDEQTQACERPIYHATTDITTAHSGNVVPATKLQESLRKNIIKHNPTATSTAEPELRGAPTGTSPRLHPQTLCGISGEGFGAPLIHLEPMRAVWRPAVAVSMLDR